MNRSRVVEKDTRCCTFPLQPRDPFSTPKQTALVAPGTDPDQMRNTGRGLPRKHSAACRSRAEQDRGPLSVARVWLPNGRSGPLLRPPAQRILSSNPISQFRFMLQVRTCREHLRR